MKKLIKARNEKRWMRLQETGFLCSLVTLPLLQFFLFYVCVNFNSILLALKTYDIETNTFSFIGFGNFARFFQDMSSDFILKTSMKNSLIQFLLTNLVSLPLSIIISYFLWKKIWFSGFFKIVIMIPQMVSGIIFVIIARFFLEKAVPVFMGDPTFESLLVSTDKGFMTVQIYGLWIGFAGGLVVFLGSMSNISTDIVEYSRFEGANSFVEFTKIVVPLIFPTITTYIVVGIAGFFTNQGAYYSFFGPDADRNFYVLGYYYFIKVVNSGSYAEYPFAAASGLIFTITFVPLTMGVKTLLEKFGPSED